MKLIQAKGLQVGDEFTDIYRGDQTEQVTAVRRYCIGREAWVEVDTINYEAITYFPAELVVVV